MEVMTEVPQSGTRLKIEADRQFEGQPGDSVLRVQGQTQEGSQVFDATYVEVGSEEAHLVGWLIRALRQPPPELEEKVAQEVQATFPSRIGGRDAQQISQLCWTGIRKAVSQLIGQSYGPQGIDTQLEHLAERFERASAKRRQAPAFGSTNGEQQQHYPAGQTATASKR